jgi:hypothetical protein
VSSSLACVVMGRECRGVRFYDSGFAEEIIPGVSFLRADRQPCPVCGHPTGDCADGAQAPRVIIGDNVSPPVADDPLVLVPEDIRTEVQITPFTRARVLLAAKGSYIPASEARAYGII